MEPSQDQLAMNLDKLMDSAMPHLARLNFLFGGAQLTLLVQVDGQPGCMVMQPPTNDSSIDDLIKALEHTKKLEAELNQ